MLVYPIFKGGMILIFLGIMIKITLLALQLENYFFAGMPFIGIGIGMVSYAAYKNKTISRR